MDEIVYFPKTLNKISLDATSVVAVVVVVVVVLVIVVAAAAFAVYVFFVVCHNDNHESLRCYHLMVINNYILTFTATRYLPPYTPHVGPLDPVTFKEATLFTCIRVH